MRILSYVFFVLCVACSSADPAKEENAGEAQAIASDNDKLDEKSCVARGGEIREVCMSKTPMCVMIYSDAGNECSDNSECEGSCQTTDVNAHAQPQVFGKCSASNDPCGCFASVKNGRAGRIICRD